jgi:hypothetical protein
MPSVSGPSAKKMAEMDAEDDLRTLSRAEEIRNDRRRMRMAQRVLTKQERGLKRLRRSVGGGRDASKRR